jgi:O-acetyl-ADP-ribose deacetylase (regulator of RNase III)
LAEQHAVETISFPAISTGVYGYPLDEAAAIALGEVRAHLNRPGVKVRHAIFVLFGQAAYDAYVKALGKLSKK